MRERDHRRHRLQRLADPIEQREHLRNGSARALGKALGGIALLERTSIELHPIGMCKHVLAKGATQSGVRVEPIDDLLRTPGHEHAAEIENDVADHLASARKSTSKARAALATNNVSTPATTNV